MSDSTSTETSTLTETRLKSRNINHRVLISVNTLVAFGTAFHLGFKIIYADFIGTGPIFQATDEFANKSASDLVLEHYTRPESPLYTNLSCLLGAILIVFMATKLSTYSLRYCLLWATVGSLVGLPFLVSTVIWKIHWMQVVGLCLSDVALVMAVCFQVCLVQDLSNQRFKKAFTFFTGIAFALGTFISCILCLLTVEHPKIRLAIYSVVFVFTVPTIFGLLAIPDPLFYHLDGDEKLDPLHLLGSSLSTENERLQKSFEFYNDSKFSTEDSKLVYTRTMAKCAYDSFLGIWMDKNGKTVAIIAIVTNVLGAVCDHLFSLRWYIHHVYQSDDSFTALFTLTFGFFLGTLLSIPTALLMSRRRLFTTACAVLFVCELGHAVVVLDSVSETVGFQLTYRIGVFLRVLQTIVSGATFSTHAWTIGAELAPRNIQLLVTAMGISSRFVASEVFILFHVSFKESESYLISPVICLALIAGAVVISIYMPQGTGFFNVYSWWMNMAEDKYALRYFEQNKDQLYTNYTFTDRCLADCRNMHLRAAEESMGTGQHPLLSGEKVANE